MGFLFVYHAIDEQTLDEMWRLPDGPFFERFQEFEENTILPSLHIGKSWDALHCTLTGVSASEPIDGDKLSECVVGVHPKIWEGDDTSTYIAVTENEEISAILSAIDSYDESKIRSILDPDKLEKQNVYPKGIWSDPHDSLVNEMTTTLEDIRSFLKQTMLAENHVLASMM